MWDIDLSTNTYKYLFVFCPLLTKGRKAKINRLSGLSLAPKRGHKSVKNKRDSKSRKSVSSNHPECVRDTMNFLV